MYWRTWYDGGIIKGNPESEDFPVNDKKFFLYFLIKTLHIQPSEALNMDYAMARSLLDIDVHLQWKAKQEKPKPTTNNKIGNIPKTNISNELEFDR